MKVITKLKNITERSRSNSTIVVISSAVSNNQRPSDYSPLLYSQIPMKYLLQRARKDQSNFRDLYPPLLRLLVTYFPQLCLVEDWIYEEDKPETQALSQTKLPSRTMTVGVVAEGTTIFASDNQNTLSANVKQ